MKTSPISKECKHIKKPKRRNSPKILELLLKKPGAKIKSRKKKLKMKIKKLYSKIEDFKKEKEKTKKNQSKVEYEDNKNCNFNKIIQEKKEKEAFDENTKGDDFYKEYDQKKNLKNSFPNDKNPTISPKNSPKKKQELTTIIHGNINGNSQKKETSNLKQKEIKNKNNNVEIQTLSQRNTENSTEEFNCLFKQNENDLGTVSNNNINSESENSYTLIFPKIIEINQSKSMPIPIENSLYINNMSNKLCDNLNEPKIILIKKYEPENTYKGTFPENFEEYPAIINSKSEDSNSFIFPPMPETNQSQSILNDNSYKINRSSIECDHRNVPKIELIKKYEPENDYNSGKENESNKEEKKKEEKEDEEEDDDEEKSNLGEGKSP